jgi:hypothetical protein
MKTSAGFQYAAQQQGHDGRWTTRISGDDLALVRKFYDQMVAATSGQSIRLLDQVSGDVLSLHVVFVKDEKVW